MEAILMNTANTGIPLHLPSRLTISFWLWALLDTGPEDVFHDLEARMIELKERGFNCIRIDSGAGLCHTASGKPRGNILLQKPFPGHSHLLRQLECFQGGECNILKRLVSLFELAKRYNVQVILSSWFYLHTFWYVDNDINKELFDLPVEERFNYFATALDRIISELKDRDLHNQIAFAEIFNEADGLPFTTDYQRKVQTDEKLECFRNLHEEAIAQLKEKHPDILFAYDTYTPFTEPKLIPRNSQVWNLHSYYIWPVYSVLEGNLINVNTDPTNPQNYASIRHFLRQKLVNFEEIVRSRTGRQEVAADWCRRIWLYRNVNPKTLPELEKVLSDTLKRDAEIYKQRALEAITHATKIRNEIIPGVPMVMGEAATYCSLNSMRWEERSETYWSLLEYMMELMKEYGYWGYMPRTNSGPDDPAWTEYPKQLEYLNRKFHE
jgi:hypothetical protein